MSDNMEVDIYCHMLANDCQTGLEFGPPMTSPTKLFVSQIEHER